MSLAVKAPEASLLTGIFWFEGLSAAKIVTLLDLSEERCQLGRRSTRRDDLRGRTLINLFFEASTRTQTTSSWRASGSAPT